MGIVANQSIKGTIATYLGVAIGFFTNFFIITKYLSAEQVGFLTNVLVNTATLFAQFSLIGVSNSTIRFFPYVKDKNSNNNGIFFWTMVIPLVGYLFFTVLFFIFNRQILDIFIDKSPLFANYYRAVLPLAFFILYTVVFETHANVCMRIVIPRFVREVVIRLCMLIFYFLYISGVISFKGLINGQCCTYAVAALINFIYLIGLGQVSFNPHFNFYKNNKGLVQSFFRYSSFLFITSIAITLTPTLISLFLSANIGEHTTGVYTIAFFIATLISMPNRSIHPIIAPQLSDSIKENNWGKTADIYNQGAKNLFIISCFIALCIWINVDIIYALLPNGKTYITGKQALFVLCLFNIMQATLGNIYVVLNYSKYYAFSFILSIGHAILTVFLANVMVTKYGILGAALSNLMAYFVFYALIIVLLYKLTGFLPFSHSMFKTAVLFVIVMLVNKILTCFPDVSIWVSSFLRSAILLSLYLFVVYRFKFSDEINRIIDKNMRRVLDFFS